MGRAFRLEFGKQLYAELLNDGLLHVYPGYAWDGSSGPAIDTKSSQRAALVHDVLYQAGRDGKLSPEDRIICDQLYRDLMLQDDAWGWHAEVRYKVLRKLAGYAYARKKREVHWAP